MTQAKQPQATPTPRRDGWTPERRRRFLEDLSAGPDVQQAFARVGMTRQKAFRQAQDRPARCASALRDLRAGNEADAKFTPEPHLPPSVGLWDSGASL